MVSVRGLLLVLAFLCFFLAAIGIAVPRVNLIALGLAFWVVTTFVAV